MKRTAFLALSAIAGLSGCVTPEPVVIQQPSEPIIVKEHHYHSVPRNVYVPVKPSTPRKSAPAVGGDSSAETFRAVERPGSYSQ